MQKNKRRLAAGAHRPHGHAPLRLIDFSCRPVTVRPDTSIGTTLRIMEENRIGSVIVVDPADGKPVGIFTLRDVLCRIAIPRADVSQPIAGVMTRDPVSVPETLSVPQTAQEMARLELRHLLVTAEDGTLTGIVSRTDIYDWMCDSCASLRRTKPSNADQWIPIGPPPKRFAPPPGDGGMN